MKRKDENQDEAKRNHDRADDMSSLEQAKSIHPGATQKGERFTQGELEWRHIGSGLFARTFPKAKNMITTTKNGPPIQEVYKRTIWSLSTGHIIDECHMDDVSD